MMKKVRKQDALTSIGLFGGLILVIWGMNSDAGLMVFFDASSLLITVGGSIASLLITVDMDDFKKMGRVFIEAFKDKKSSGQDIIMKFSIISKKARKEGLLSLEEEITKIDDIFLSKGLQMVVDGIEQDTIREILELEIGEMEDRHLTGASLFSTWGIYAPGFGMLGTLIGLIQMLVSLEDASLIASGMSRALITTFYGSLIANIFCNPIAANLQRKSAKETKEREMMLEGILAIQSGINPRTVEEKLVSYLSPKERLVYLKKRIEKTEGDA